MRPVYVISTDPLSGKTGLCASLLLEGQSRGLSVGYMKPIGDSPVRSGKSLVDSDPYELGRVLSLEADPALMSPVVLTPQFIHEQLTRSRGNCPKAVADAYDQYSQRADLVVLEGLSGLHEGRWLGLSCRQIARLLGADVVLVVRFEEEPVLDNILAAKDALGDALCGVVLNRILADRLPLVNNSVIPFLTDEGVNVLGSVVEDERLRAVTVDELVRELGGTYVVGEDLGGESVESFMVGAMGERKALTFFKKKSGKAVITGGDRENIQLAALGTKTRALILTGNQKPTKRVTKKAQETSVPVVIVDMDTLTAVERVEGLVGRIQAHDERRIKRMRELFNRALDLGAILDGLEE